MATSRPIRRGEWLTWLTDDRLVGANHTADRLDDPVYVVLQENFGLHTLGGTLYRIAVNVRVFDLDAHASGEQRRAAVANGTAPGLYVREGDDTSNLEAFLAVLRQRRDEAVAARRGEAVAAVRGQGEAASETVTRRDDEIRVGDVVEVVSCSDAFTATADVGGGGRVVSIEHENAPTRAVYLSPCDGLRVPRAGFVSLADVRKVSSPPQTVAVTVSPMSDGEAARIEAAVTDEARRSVSSPLASSSDETTTRRVVNPVPPAVSVSLRPRDFNSATITDYLQSLGATHIHVRQAPGSLPVVEAAGLSQQAFDTVRAALCARCYAPL